MAIYSATAEWTLGDGEDFLRGRYSRGHRLTFGSGFQGRLGKSVPLHRPTYHAHKESRS